MRNAARFRRMMWSHFRQHRRHFPWRRTRDPYRILVSEVMLQQTQTSRVLQYYDSFLRTFPDFRTLARAPTKKVLASWQGLGYNRRALALKNTAEIVVGKYGGRLPSDPERLMRLPGIGSATAGALCAFAFNKPVPFVETNIRRVYIDFFFPRKKRVTDAEILERVTQTMDKKRPREWFWALMDYGATLGTKKENPNQKSAVYKKQPPFRGSFRELRGKTIKLFLAHEKLSEPALRRHLRIPQARLRKALRALMREGFLQKEKQAYVFT